MAGQLERGPLTDVEKRVLASLCALEDGDEPVVGASAVNRLGMDDSTIYRAISRLVGKGWIAGETRPGRPSPLTILARPPHIEERVAYLHTLATFSNRHPDDLPAKRDCTNCARPFPSSGWNNRLCDKCRKSTDADDWMGELVSC